VVDVLGTVDVDFDAVAESETDRLLVDMERIEPQEIAVERHHLLEPIGPYA
jgi:hypothetical protein